jgi:4-amino-4-deoxy-L-arabinose transferase-like glycosyltransferase
MNDTGSYPSNQRRIDRLILVASVVGICFLFVPLETMTRIGVQVSPLGNIREKTVFLFRAIKLALPILGVIQLAWLLTPESIRYALSTRIRANIVYSSWIMPAIVVLTLLLHLGWVFYYPTELYADSKWYFEKASNISRGEGYIYDTISRKPTAVWPVGYPAFLALIFRITGPDEMVAKFANVALAVCIVCLTYLIALRLFDHTIGVFSAFFIAILPGFISYNSLVCSDVLFMALVMSVLLLTLDQNYIVPSSARMSWLLALVTGMVSGFMSITRSTGLMLLPLWIIIRWLSGRHSPISLWRWVLAMGIGTAIVVLPWTARNYVYFHRLIPVSTNGGMNFWMGNNPLAYGGYVFPRDDVNNPFLRLIGDEIAIDQTGYDLGFKFVREHPFQVLKLLPAKIFYLYNANDAGLEWNIRSSVLPRQSGTGTWAYTLANLIYIVLALFAILGVLILFLRERGAQSLVWIGAIFTIYWTIIHLPFFGSDRFSLPLLPFLTMYAASGIRAASQSRIIIGK